MDFLKLVRARYSVRQYQNRPVEPEKVEQLLEAAQAAPTAANCQPVRLLVKWCFPAEGRKSGSWRTAKPDTDNLEKALKDEMTRLHFWDDDAQVCSEIVEKFWSDPCGVFVRVEEL